MKRCLILPSLAILLICPSGYALEKNVASQQISVFCFDSTDNSPKTGDAAQVDCQISKDGGALTACDDALPDEIGRGVYSFDLTQAETNADEVTLTPYSSSADVECVARIVNTNPQYFSALGIESDGDLTKVDALDGHTAQTGDSYARLGAPAGASVSADIAVIDGNVDDVETDTNDLQTNQGNWATATGFSTHAAADVWSVVTRTLTSYGDGSGFTAIPWASSWDAEVQSEATDALNAYDPPTNAELTTAVGDVSVDEIQATALADLFNTDSGTTYASAVAGSVVKETADNAGGSSLTESGIADAVWDELLSGHTGGGSAGEALDNAGSGASASTIADAVWDEVIVGAHDSANSAGALLDSPSDWETATGFSTHSAADVVNEWESQSQADPTGFHVNVKEVNGTAQTAGDLADLITTLDAVADAIKAKTDNLPADPADDSDIDSQLATIDSLIDAIKLKIDRMQQ